MKNLTKVLAVAVVATMALSSVSVFAEESEENMTKSERPAFSMKAKDNDAPMAKQEKKEKPSKVAMTEEEKTAKIEKLKTDLATKLEVGEITQEEYDEKLAKIEARDFMRGNKGGRGVKGEKPEMTDEEKAAKIEELKADLAAKLEAGEITQEEYDEKLAKIEAGDFIRGDKGGRSVKGEKPEMTDEEKADKIEELKTDLATKLEAGEITQEEYDDAVAEIEAGNFKLGSKDGRNLKGERKNFSKIKIETDSE